MSKKLLVITAGTVAAGVGQTLSKQMQMHSGSELRVLVRHIDTAYLLDRYQGLRPGEWFQLAINPRYMQAIHSSRAEHPALDQMLFDELLPSTDSSGGGSIRYNGASAIEVKRKELREWLSASMTSLARMEDGDKNISIALIISAVGATGSGSIEHLLDVIIDAAHYADISSTTQSTIRCDVYILQPSQEATDLGLANTLALYAELAASQLAGSGIRAYQGRKVMIGWGSTYALGSLDQLREAAATIIRLSSDPSSSFAAEFHEREVDNHVLRELDPISNLPMHLSLATVVTIGLGHLEEQVIQRDVRRLIDNLVFESSASSGDDVLLGRFADALAGDTPDSRYQKMLDYLSENVHLNELQKRIDSIANARNTPDGEKGVHMTSAWREAVEEVKQSRHRIEDFARRFTTDAMQELDRIKADRICKGNVSLTMLREEYRSLELLLQNTLAAAQADTRTSVNDRNVTIQIQRLNGPWPIRLFNRKAKLRRVATAMKGNIQEHLQTNARASAIRTLGKLKDQCAEIGRNLDIILNKLRRQRDDQHLNTEVKFNLDIGNPLNIVALPTIEEMRKYASQVSVFTSETDAPEQLAEFRKWLQDAGHSELEALFKGNLDQLLAVVTRYTTEKVREAMEKQSVLDILHRAGDDALNRRLEQAHKKATSLVSYSSDFAPARREAWHVSAFYRTEDQREELDQAIKEVFTQGNCRLLPSNDPTEIAVFYYVDGIPMSAVEDLKGRCLNAFLRRRQQWGKWQEQKAHLNGHSPNGRGPVSSIDSLNRRVGVPVYSGKDAEQRVLKTGVIKNLYRVKGVEVDPFNEQEFPELQ